MIDPESIIQKCNTWEDFQRELDGLENKEKGNDFEELTRLYWLTDSTFSTKIDAIWLHSKIPQELIDELGLQVPSHKTLSLVEEGKSLPRSLSRCAGVFENQVEARLIRTS